MSKSILVVDTPDACIDCPCHFAYENGTVHCGVRKKQVLAEDVETHKPGWCPLMPTPKRKEVCGRYPQEDGIVPSYKVGYNACIEEMLEKELNNCVDYHRRYGHCGNQIYAYKRALEIVKSGGAN